MKKIIKLTEQNLMKIISRVNEEIDFNDYDDMDFIEAFLVTFRQWISGKLGDDVKKYPLSYLLKKYGKSFEKELKINGGYEEDNDDEYNYSRYKLLNSARNLVKMGKYNLPNMNVNEKFTEKYKRVLPEFVKQLNLPDYVSMKFEENEPNKVNVKFDVDFPNMLVAEKRTYLNSNNFLDKFKKYLSNYVGVEFGNPAYGEVQMKTDKINYVGLEDWVKSVLNKKLKKDIKNLPNATNVIHSIKFEVQGGTATMKIVFKDSFGYGRRNTIMSDISQYIKDQGYNPEIFKVER